MQQRVNSLDALVADQIVDHDNESSSSSASDEEMFDEIHPNIKHADEGMHHNDNDKLIALVNGGSGARKAWALAKDLQKYNTSVYNLKDLAVNELVRHRLAS